MVVETVDEGDGLVSHGLGVGGIVLGLRVVAGGPQQEIFSEDKFKVTKTLYDHTYFVNDRIHHDCLVGTLVLMNF